MYKMWHLYFPICFYNIVSVKPKPKPKPEASVPKKENDKVKKEKKPKRPVPANFKVCLINIKIIWYRYT